MSRRKPFWHVAPQYYAGVAVGTVVANLTWIAMYLTWLR
jgi:hypothetical protein